MMEGFVWKSLFCFVFFFRKLVCELSSENACSFVFLHFFLE